MAEHISKQEPELQEEKKEITWVHITMFFIFAIALFGTQTISTVATTPIDIKSRNLSSIEPAGLETFQKVGSSFAVQLSCDPQTVVQKSEQYPFVRITSASCGSRISEEIQITNMTNGYQASVLKLGENAFTSDLIRLKPGTNRIMIINKHSDGSDHRRTLTVVNNSSLDRQE